MILAGGGSVVGPNIWLRAQALSPVGGDGLGGTPAARECGYDEPPHPLEDAVTSSGEVDFRVGRPRPMHKHAHGLRL